MQRSFAPWLLSASLLLGCGDDASSEDASSQTTGSGGSGGGASSGSGAVGNATSVGGTGGIGAGGSTGGTGGDPDPGPDVDLSDPQMYEFELDPQELDPSTTDSLEPQYALLDTTAQPLGRLVIFLTGSTNVPIGWREHGRELAGMGFHVVIPHYNNRWSSEGVCDGGPPNCGTDTRWEALVGEDASSVIAISRADSAEGRVVTMLNHLVGEHPGGDWGYYLDGSEDVRYDKIVIAGISHGASSTGLYATRRAFSRAVLHSGGAAGDPNATKETPLSAWYAFAHTGDPAFDAITGSWQNHELLGDVTTIDGASPPYDGAHQLISSAESDYPHCSTAVHSSSPLDGNTYAFEPAWRHMYGAP